MPSRQLLVSGLVRRTRRHLLSFSRQVFNQVNTLVPGTAAATTISLALDGSNIPTDSYVTLEDETMYVTASSAASITVIRGMDDTTIAAHDGTVTPLLMEVNPRYPRGAIREAILEEIRSWSPDLFRVRTGTLLTNIGTRGYDIGPGGSPTSILDPDWLYVLDVHRSTNQSGLAYGYNALVKTWPRVPFHITNMGSPGLMPTTQAEAPTAAPSGPNQQQGAVTQFQGGFPADIPSGVQLVLEANYYNTQMAVTWATDLNPPDPLADTVDLVAQCDIDVSWGAIAEYGAAARLLISKESLRNTIESAATSRNATEVPPDSLGRAADRLMRWRDKEFQSAIGQLRLRYPTRFK